ncbi:MAG: hypothetical protein ABEI99_01770 [Halobaculum sp.]
MDGHPPYVCEILKLLLSRHSHGGSPLPREVVVNLAAVPSHDLDDAKETFETRRTSPEYPFVSNEGPKHVLIDNGEFPALVDFLYYECGWSAFKIDNSVRHYDVRGTHSFD